MRSTCRILIVVVAATILLASTGVASAQTANDLCRECHASVFEAPAVDYSKCDSCHWIDEDGKIGSYFDHTHGDWPAPYDQCDYCHYGWPARDAFYVPSVMTPYGYFDSADSTGADADSLHATHANGSWAVICFNPPYCASCHAPASCDACHAEVPHGEHTYADDGSSPYPGVTMKLTDGAPKGSTYPLTSYTGLSTCADPACHALDEVAEEGFVPACANCHGSAHHELHDASAYMRSGCESCHSPYLDTEHEDRGYGCAVCHSSTDPVVTGAIAAGDLDCETCHPDRHGGGSRGSGSADLSTSSHETMDTIDSTTDDGGARHGRR
jgi:hypothetical protein